MIGELEARLIDLGAALEVPPAADVVPAVLARLPEQRVPEQRAPEQRVPERRVPERRARAAQRTRRTLALGIAGLLALGATAFAVPPTRHAILRVLGLRGITIERVPVLPRVPGGEGARLGLGVRIPLARARHAAAFTALLPTTTSATATATATAAYIAHDIPGGRISLLVGRLLVSEFRATAIPIAFKEIGPGTHVTFVQIRGGQAVYLSGAPHVVVFQESNGTIRHDRVVVEGNVLVWQDGPVTVRIEGARTLAQALAVARSLH